jgi:hypothetical protein
LNYLEKVQEMLPYSGIAYKNQMHGGFLSVERTTAYFVRRRTKLINTDRQVSSCMPFYIVSDEDVGC